MPKANPLEQHTQAVYVPQQVPQPEAASVAGSDHSSHTSYIPSNRAFQSFNSFHSNTTAHSQPPTPHLTAHPQAFTGVHSHPYDISPEGSSQTDSTDHSYVPPQYQSVVQPGVQYLNAAVTPDQLTHLRNEVAKKKQRIAELEHEVGTADNHRRQVQTHNFELEGQLAQMQQLLQVRGLFEHLNDD